MNLPSLPKISGKFDAPKPWQIGVGVGAVVVLVLAGPAIKDALLTHKQKQVTAQIAQAGKAGEPWHPVAYPVPPKTMTPMPTPPVLQNLPMPAPPPNLAAAVAPVATPQKANLAASGASGKDKGDDPEQDAINSPIQLGGGPGGKPGGTVETTSVSGRSRSGTEAGTSSSALAGLLKPTELEGYQATVMQHPEATIEQGRKIACHNVTPMTSSLPGFVSADIKYDVWSADDSTVLIDHDSTAFGEISHSLTNGQDRMFVLWRQITTPKPNRVRITLNSPGADEMGEAGVGGPDDVNHHYKQKIGGALLLSGIEAFFSGASGALSNIGRGNGNSQSQGLNLNLSQVGSQGSNLASQLLASTITIPDTMHIKESTPCTIFVSGDLVFNNIYATKRKFR